MEKSSEIRGNDAHLQTAASCMITPSMIRPCIRKPVTPEPNQILLNLWAVWLLYPLWAHWGVKCWYSMSILYLCFCLLVFFNLLFNLCFYSNISQHSTRILEFNLVEKWDWHLIICAGWGSRAVQKLDVILRMIFARVLEACMSNREDRKMNESNYKSFRSCTGAISYSYPVITLNTPSTAAFLSKNFHLYCSPTG